MIILIGVVRILEKPSFFFFPVVDFKAEAGGEVTEGANEVFFTAGGDAAWELAVQNRTRIQVVSMIFNQTTTK